jgi:hypothetical protein
MIGTQLSLVNRQRPLVERLRLRILALILVEQGQVVQAGRRVGMIWPHLLLADGQRPLRERLRLCILALIPVELRQVVQAGRCIGMIGTQRLLTDGQRLCYALTAQFGEWVKGKGDRHATGRWQQG